MGRLENFIPIIKDLHIKESARLSLLECQGSQIPLENDVLPFVKHINGHMSLREIFLFIVKSGEQVSIEKSLAFLDHLASLKLLANGDDYEHLSHSSRRPLPSVPSGLTASYFSEERLLGLIQKTTLFLECDRKTAKNILNFSKLENHPAKTRLIAQGSKSTEFFVLLTGEVEVGRDGKTLASLGPLTVFGESAAIFNRSRNADVTTTDNCWLLRIDASKLIDTNSATTFEAFKGLRSRLILNQTLSANPLFRNIPTDILQFFISRCRIEKWGKEQTVIEQDETSGDFYFILQGSVAVVKNGVPVTSLTEGNHFGEVAAMFHEPRTASIITETACTFLVLNQKALFEVLCSHFGLAVAIERTAKKRMQSKGNILGIFEDSFEADESTSEVDLNEFSQSHFDVDEDFLEVSTSNFDLEIVDFTKVSDEAS